MADYHRSFDPLPLEVRNGMIAMGIFGLLSTVSTFTLMAIITYRMVYWRRYYNHPMATNQVFVLIYNLLLADFQQGLSFLFSFYWLSEDKLVGPSSACFAQGWLIQIGDVSSGLWVLAIAAHTFINLVGQKTIRYTAFVSAIVALWTFCLFLTAIGPVLSKDNEFFVPAGAWCWIGERHKHERFYLHCLWIFISQLGSLVIYISVFFSLRSRLANSSKLHNTATSSKSDDSRTGPYKGGPSTTTTISSGEDSFAVSKQRILRTARYMVVYPFAYVFLTLPLATGRIATMTGHQPPLVFFPIAGTMMASCGIIDVILYLTTRQALVRSSVGVVKGPDNCSTMFTSADSISEKACPLYIVGGSQEGDERTPAVDGAPSCGAIVVSQSVVMSADSFTDPVVESGSSQRSDSPENLLFAREEVPKDCWLRK